MKLINNEKDKNLRVFLPQAETGIDIDKASENSPYHLCPIWVDIEQIYNELLAVYKNN